MKDKRTRKAHRPKPARAMYLLLFTLLLSTLLLSQLTAPTSASGVAPDLDDAENFGLLADTLTTVETTVHNGDAGAVTHTGTLFTPDGDFYIGGTEYQAANTALGAAIADANAQAPTETGAAGADLGGETLLPGVYDYPGAVDIGSNVTLSGNGVFIFQIGGTFDMAADTTIVLADGAQACNVFWVPEGATTLAANTHFSGNLLKESAATTVGITTIIDGRILSQGAVTFTGPGPSDIHVPQECNPVDEPALSIDKESVEDSVAVGDTVNNTVTVTNTGNVPLTDVAIRDTFDSNHMTFVEVTGVTTVDTTVAGQVSWDHGTLDPGQSVTYNLSFTAETVTGGGGTLNTAVAFSDEHDLQVEATATIDILEEELAPPEEESEPPAEEEQTQLEEEQPESEEDEPEEEQQPLPATGGNSPMMLLLGTLLAAAGFGLWMFSRRRNV